MKRIPLVLLTVVLLSACGKKQDAPQPGAGSATPVAVVADAAASGEGSAAGSADSAQAADVDVPTEVDFEDQATADIDDRNVEARVKAIEQELAQ